MNAAGDKMVTNGNEGSNTCSRKGRRAGPTATVKSGSASVTIYLAESKGRKRYVTAHCRDGAGKTYVSQLKTILNRLAEAFLGEILGASSSDIDVRALKLDWPRKALRHSFISCLIAKVKSADQVALEAGNSPSVVFKNYRELAREEQADEWFGILPKEGQWKNTCQWDHRARIVTLPDSEES